LNSLNVNLAGLVLDNPIIPASGTFGFGYEFSKIYNINILGSIVLKSVTKKKLFGNPTPRIAECENGMLNSIGLENPGVKDAVKKIFNLKKIFKKKVVASVAGFSKDEYKFVTEKISKIPNVGIVELNLSCPNVEEDGINFSSKKRSVISICKAVKSVSSKPIFAKLSPNVTDITEIALAAQGADVDGITLCNTLLGLELESKTGKPVLPRKIAGFSGRAIKPINLRCVYQVYKKINIPIMGVGGVQVAEDILDYMSAGAVAVQVGSENLVNPMVCQKIIEDLPKKLREYRIKNISDIIGRSHR
jgi:dihydroorotate dehydrogenase (NAD+) catalytic subunit